MRFNYHISLLGKPASESIASSKYFTITMGIVLACLKHRDSVTVWELKNGEWTKYRDYTYEDLDRVKEVLKI